MPRRTNFFQRVMAAVQLHMADGATVEESAMLVDADTGDMREVDIVVTGDVGGHPMKVGIEVTSTKRKAAVGWVEEMLGKHRRLATNHLVLVSESGFSESALKKAEHGEATAVFPEALLDGDVQSGIINKLDSIFQKMIELVPEGAIATLVSPQGEEFSIEVPPGVVFQRSDGTQLGTISSEMARRYLANMEEINEQIGLADFAKDAEYPFEMNLPDWEIQESRENGTEAVHAVYLLGRTGPGQPEIPYRINHVIVTGVARISVGEIPLNHKRLGKVSGAFGQGEIAGGRTIFVVTQDDKGETASIRLIEADGAERIGRLKSATGFEEN